MIVFLELSIYIYRQLRNYIKCTIENENGAHDFFLENKNVRRKKMCVYVYVHIQLKFK